MAKPGSPKVGVRAEINTFVKGLITEASPLNFPPNASKDEENFELNSDGTRDRRFGMDYESGFSLISLPVDVTSASGSSSFKWAGVGGVALTDFLVVQFGNNLYFFDLAVTPLSTDGLVGTVSLTGFDNTSKFSFSSIQGSLVVVAGADVVKVVSYDSDTSLFSVVDQRIIVRDVWGVESGEPQDSDISYRNAARVDLHLYNLQNQSWGIPRRSVTATSDPIEVYATALGKYPSNSEVVWTGLQFQAVEAGADPFERIYPNLYEERIGIDTNAAKGYFLIDLLRRGQSRNTAIASNKLKYPALLTITPIVPIDLTNGGATIASTFAGRVFFSGFSGSVSNPDKRSPSLSNFVVFSKLVSGTPDITSCYQVGDPTSRESSDLVDTDGGFMRIDGAKNIISLEDMETHLIVVAENGVWSISGGSDFGFSATNYKVSKLSSYGCISKSSIITDGGRKFFWANDGIYMIAKNQYGDFEVTSQTQVTIQTLYNAIPSVSKEKAIGIYDPSNKKLRWIYKDVDDVTDKELIFDLTLSAFYQHKIFKGVGAFPDIVGTFTNTPFGLVAIDEEVFVGGDNVLSVSEQVVVPSTVRASGIQSVQYLSLVPSSPLSFTFSSYLNTQFIDWRAFNSVGVDAKAFLNTGEITGGDTAIYKQIPYLNMHFLRTEDGVLNGLPANQSSCMVRSMWDWSNSQNANKWSPLFQTYRYRKAYIPMDEFDAFDTGFQVLSTKNKLRGRGKAFSLYMETEPLKDCRILGWVLTGNANAIT